MQMPILVNKELLEKCTFGTGSACKIRGQGNLSEELKQTKNRKKKNHKETPPKQQQQQKKPTQKAHKTTFCLTEAFSCLLG